MNASSESAVALAIDRWEFRYTLTLAEYRQFVGTIRASTLANLNGALTGLGINAVSAVLTFPLAKWVGLFPAIFLFVVVTCVLFAAWRYVLVPKLQEELFRGQPLHTNEVYLAIDQDGVHSNTGETEARSSWSTIAAARQTPDLVVLQQSRLIAFVIPKRAFVGADSVARLLAFAESRIASKQRSQ